MADCLSQLNTPLASLIHNNDTMFTLNTANNIVTFIGDGRVENTMVCRLGWRNGQRATWTSSAHCSSKEGTPDSNNRPKRLGGI